MPLVGGVARIYRGSPAVDRRRAHAGGRRRPAPRARPLRPRAGHAVLGLRVVVGPAGDAAARLRADAPGRPLRPGGAPARPRQGRPPRAPAGARQGAVAAASWPTRRTSPAGRSRTSSSPSAARARSRSPSPATTASSARSATCSPIRRPRTRSSACRAGSRSSSMLRLLEGLSERERTILHGRFGLDCPELTLRELAERLGVSAERVRQIEERALSRLRDAVDSRWRAPYVRTRVIMAASAIVSCTNCGKKNRVAVVARGVPRCAVCQHAAAVDRRRRSRRTSTARSTPTCRCSSTSGPSGAARAA